MKEANFTDLVRQKIEERRDGRSAAVRAAAEADDRFRALAAPVVAAVSALVKQLSGDAMFSNAMGKMPEMTVRRIDQEGRHGDIKFEGESGALLFDISGSDEIWMQIMPNFVVMTALDCGFCYAIEPIKGDLSHIEDFIDRVRDHIAEYLADIYLSPAAHLLEPTSKKPRMFDGR
jgi:hypothetical protein